MRWETEPGPGRRVRRPGKGTKGSVPKVRFLRLLQAQTVRPPGSSARREGVDHGHDGHGQEGRGERQPRHERAAIAVADPEAALHACYFGRIQLANLGHLANVRHGFLSLEDKGSYITPARKKLIAAQAFQLATEPCQAGKPELLPCRGNKECVVIESRAPDGSKRRPALALTGKGGRSALPRRPGSSTPGHSAQYPLLPIIVAVRRPATAPATAPITSPTTGPGCTASQPAPDGRPRGSTRAGVRDDLLFSCVSPPSTFSISASETGCILMVFPFLTKRIATSTATGPPSSGAASHLLPQPAWSTFGSRCWRAHGRLYRRPAVSQPASAA